MTRIMQTAGCGLPVKEIEGQRVVSYRQIAGLHQVPIKNLQYNFNHNQKHFIEGVDFFKIKEDHPHTKNFLVWKLYFTESGYLMLVKSLTDDLAWEVQRMLVNSYFRVSLLERVLPFLSRRLRLLVHYRSLGLTQRETARLLGVSRDSVRSAEKRLKSLGYSAPNLSGSRTAFAARAEQLELPL